MYLFSFIPATAANNDSLWNVWNDASRPDTLRMNALKNITWKVIFDNPDSGFMLAGMLYDHALKSNDLYMQCWSYKAKGIAKDIEGDYDEALKLYFAGLKIAEEADILIEQGNFYHNIALVYRNQGDYKKALDAYNKSLEIRKKASDTAGLANTYNNIGVVYLIQGNVPLALEYFHKNLDINTALGDEARTAQTIQNIGLIYLDQGELDNALDYLKRSMDYYEKTGRKRVLSHTYNNIGIIYKEMGKYDLALDYYHKGLAFSRSLKDKNNIASIYRNIGNVFSLRGEDDTALIYFKKSLKIVKEIGDKNGLAAAYNDLGYIYNQIGNPQEAKKWCGKAYRLAKESDYLEEIKNSCKCLMKANKALGNITKAFQFQEEYYRTRDSLDKREDFKKVTRLSLQYEYEKARLADSLAMVQDNLKTEMTYQKKISEARNREYVFLSFGLLILVIAGALFWRLSYIRKTNRELEEKNTIIEYEKQRAEESERSKEQFFSNVSHELRTPLTLIIGPVEKLIREIDNEKVRQELDIIYRNARRLLTMINELLNLYKLESGKIVLKASKDDIVEFTSQFVRTFQSLADEKDIGLKFESPLKELCVYFDKEKMENVLGNLLSNAFKFTNAGGSITVTVASDQHEKLKGCEESEGVVKISVADTGIGIPREKQPHIFDRFYQVDDVLKRNIEGTGIGLALTKELVDLHHGVISVESKEGKGSVFTVKLPLGKKHLKTGEILVFSGDSEDSAEDVTGTQKAGEGKVKDAALVLIVEDNKDMRAYIRSCIDPDYKVIEAGDGEKGLNKAISHVPDLIISDVMMPRMDGTEMARRIKSDERTSHIPIILLTARSSMEYKIQGLETGADDYLEKPFNARELKVRIKNLIEQRKKLREKLLKSVGIDFAKTETHNAKSIDEQFLQKAISVVMKYISDPEFSVESFGREMAMKPGAVAPQDQSANGAVARSVCPQHPPEKCRRIP
ncbi:MAG: tetratricopeptide repeat protein [Chlorobi bacterium]|nr:tetratricopeptide repeat protein [Chlorobiota bacterium]